MRSSFKFIFSIILNLVKFDFKYNFTETVLSFSMKVYLTVIAM